ncbi:cysteine protease ATG4A isoform X2 [Atheta coriaria]|uniref:cysteine protease ATG4A isoform X2 n=1 Tax=Dalotia coriaria TaxID=877792 RepID=UPI0031F458AE
MIKAERNSISYFRRLYLYFRQLCIKAMMALLILREIMDCMFEAYLTDGNSETDDIPLTKEPVYILGIKYDANKELTMIRQDIQSRLWFTYRRGFVPIGGGDGLTSDKGWGCMLRCGQMVLGQALVILHLGRDWLWDAISRDPVYLKILKKFEDNRHAPYSIHQIALMGASEGKEVGQWFGPNTIAQVLKRLVKFDSWNSLVIHVALDNTMIVNDIRELCFAENSPSNTSMRPQWKPLLLVVPLRLGLNEINPIYISGLKKCFKFPQSLGVIGGKPNLALYFIGCVGDEVIYLDPHTTQRTGCVEGKENEEQVEMDSTYHCKRASRINILQMDPSVAVCFFCEQERDFDDLCQLIRDKLIADEKQALFEICNERPEQYSPSVDCIDCSDRLCDSENEFEIL